MPVSLHMGWRHVLFASWPVEPAVVEPHLPDSLTLDTFDGRAWLSAVPFTNVDVRPRAMPAGTGLGLPELNLRTYATLDGRADEGTLGSGSGGVYFFSLDADGMLAVLGARFFHHLPYYYASIDLDASHGSSVRFSSRRRHPGARPVAFDASYGPVGERFHAEPESLEAFLVDRDRYYTESPDGALRYATVDHEPWPLYEAEAPVDAVDLFAANGFDVPAAEPVHLYSPGVDTIASRSRRVK